MERVAVENRPVLARTRGATRHDAPAARGSTAEVLQLQRTAGNRAVTSLLQRCSGGGCGCGGACGTEDAARAHGPGCSCGRCSRSGPL